MIFLQNVDTMVRTAVTQWKLGNSWKQSLHLSIKIPASETHLSITGRFSPLSRSTPQSELFII